MRRFPTLIAVVVIIFSLDLTPSVPLSAAASNLSSGSLNERLDALTKIQPGLGTVMTEYGNRFVDVYFAARGRNWGLAQYQLHEMLEIQEVGEATRPKHAANLKAFEDGYLKPLSDTILKKDWNAFQELYGEAADGCNACHAATGHAFIHFKLPTKPVEDYLDFSVKTDPTPAAQ
jgi:hypothetical protein